MKNDQARDIVITRYWIRSDEPDLGYGVYKYHRWISLSILPVILCALIFLIILHGSPVGLIMAAVACLLSLCISSVLYSRWAGWYILDDEGRAQALYARTTPADISVGQSMNRQSFMNKKGNVNR